MPRPFPLNNYSKIDGGNLPTAHIYEALWRMQPHSCTRRKLIIPHGIIVLTIGKYSINDVEYVWGFLIDYSEI